MKGDLPYTLLACAVLALSLIPVGTAVFLLGFVYGDSPCVMCWEQRTGMAIIALIGLFVLRYGPRPKYIGLSILVGAWGIFMGLRHTGMHAARDIGQGFSIEIIGAHTYTWALFIFWICVATMGLLLIMLRENESRSAPRLLRPIDKLAAGLFLMVIAGNIFQAFASTGPPPFMGQGDPVRFSFNPKHWVWSLEEWNRAPVSLRGRWAAEKPDIAALPRDPAEGPLANLPALSIRERKRIPVKLQGPATDLTHDAETGRFCLTTPHGVYLLDDSLTRVLRETIVDPGYSVDLGRFAGTAFFDSRTVIALGENKSYVILRESAGNDPNGNFRFFLESPGAFDEVSRSRLGTVRARMMYVNSLAFDPEKNSLYTVTVPNARTKQMVVSRFDRGDMVLSEEFVPRLAPGSGLTFGSEKRSLDEYYVTGAAIAAGRLYAVSAAFSTILTVDLASHMVVAAYAVRDLVRPTGMAIRGGDFCVISDDGTLSTIAMP